MLFLLHNPLLSGTTCKHRQTVTGKSDLLTQRSSSALLVFLIVDVTEGACSDYEVKFAPHNVGAGYFGSLCCQCRSAKTGLTRAPGRFYPSPCRPLPRSVSILSLLPPPCLTFILNTSHAAVCWAANRPGVSPLHAREACLIVFVCVTGKVF